MTTSANVTDYIIEKGGVKVGSHSQHCYCKTNWHKLCEFLPLDEHQIIAYGLDEDEAPWENPAQNLEKYLLNEAQSGVCRLTDNGEMYFWRNEYNGKISQHFGRVSDAVVSFHSGLLVWETIESMGAL